jgi:glycerol uptake facilitator-like aquaporin
MVVHEKNRSTFMSALPYGLTMFSCHLFATRYTNAAINPARAFASSVVARNFTRDHWIYWLGYVLLSCHFEAEDWKGENIHATEIEKRV